MSPPPPRSPAECLGAIIRWLSLAVDMPRSGDRLAPLILAAIIDRLRGINQRFARLAARVGAGRYVPRQATAGPRRAAIPRRPDPLPQTAGWLVGLVPEAIGARAQLEYLFRDPEMAALMQAAPATLRRPLRSLCRMLGATPPAVLALPPRPRKPRLPRPAPPKPPPPPPLEQPAWMRLGPQRKPWSLARIRGSPKRA